jgi:two-component system, chemotaxis family, chemotaxis protein CheY
MRALIVDDSRFIRDYLRSLLEDHGIECVEAENGQLGLAAIAELGPCELALVDMNMPVMGGLEFVKAIRSNRRMKDLKILMVTTEAENSFIEAALDAGADEYLMKPFDDAALLDKLQMIGFVQD